MHSRKEHTPFILLDFLLTLKSSFIGEKESQSSFGFFLLTALNVKQ